LNCQILNFLFWLPDSSIFGFDQVFAQDEVIDAIMVWNNPFGMTYNADMVICMRQSSVHRQPVNHDSNVLCLEDFNRIE
jgi:trimethylamine:corrinoid methyltransferase-like protein